jgi:hypothetical protein
MAIGIWGRGVEEIASEATLENCGFAPRRREGHPALAGKGIRHKRNNNFPTRDRWLTKNVFD